MASLETLTLEIGGNAAQASGSIGNLITSLGELGTAVRNEIPSLRELAQLLRQIKGSSGILNFGKGLNVSAIAKATKATKDMNSELAKSQQIMKSGASVMPGTDVFGRQLDKNVPFIMQNGQTFGPEINGVRELQKEAEKATTAVNNLKQAVQETGTTGGNGLGSSHSARELRMMARGNGVSVGEIADREAARNVQEMNSAIEQTTPAATEAGQALQTMNNAQQELGADAQKAARAINNSYKDSFKSVSKASFGLLQQIGRIAKTMLIRTALKAVFKMAKEGLENYYQYSKTIAGDYAATADKLKDATNTAGNQVGAAIASLINAAAPALMTLLDIVAKLAEALTMIFSLLSGKTTYSKAKEGFGSIASSAGGASSAMKELLAQFDELNVIAQEGGGGGGGGASGNYGEMFEEVDLPQWMIDFKWLIELAAYATLAFLALKKILDLINLFKLIKNPFGGIGFGTEFKFPIQPDYKDFPAQPPYMPFPIQPDYKEFPIQPEYHPFPEAPDYFNCTVQMLAFGAAIMVASKEMAALAAQTLILSALLGTIKDKRIHVTLDKRDYDKRRGEIDKWVNERVTKNITVSLNQSEYTQKKKLIDDWVGKKATKDINVNVNLQEFDNARRNIEKWTSETTFKPLMVDIRNWGEFRDRMGTINKWVSDTGEKIVRVVMKGYDDFMSMAKKINDWAKEKLTKTVTVVIKFTTDGSDFSTWLAGNDLPSGGGGNAAGGNVRSQSNTSGAGDGGVHGAGWGFGSMKLADLLPESWFRADGGMVKTGDLFIANEQGPELVGSFGGQTGVANQGQIIEGISRGVADANAEQNTLLRQQNELLRGILEKDSSVRISASAAFGRVASQSLAMYGSMTGG